MIMKPKIFYTDIISSLASLGHRQLDNELRAAEYIKTLLSDYNIDYKLQRYTVLVPKILKATLKADGINIPCRGTSFISGKITSKDNIISNLYSSKVSSEIPNINFNPQNDDISESNYYNAPAISVSRNDIGKIISANKIEGEVRVEKVSHTTYNILVGNRENPANIVFTHFDSINAGAIDNASGVAIVLKTIIDNPTLLKTTLFAICACEELSYDKPTYWAAGYRRFENKYLPLMEKSKMIIVTDSVGHSKPIVVKDDNLLRLGFAIKNINKFAPKSLVLTGDFDELMKVYHSNADNGAEIKDTFMASTQRKLEGLLFSMI